MCAASCRRTQVQASKLFRVLLENLVSWFLCQIHFKLHRVQHTACGRRSQACRWRSQAIDAARTTPSRAKMQIAIYLHSQPDRKTTKPTSHHEFVAQICNTLMLLGRNEAVEGLISLKGKVLQNVTIRPTWTETAVKHAENKKRKKTTVRNEGD